MIKKLILPVVILISISTIKASASSTTEKLDTVEEWIKTKVQYDFYENMDYYIFPLTDPYGYNTEIKYNYFESIVEEDVWDFSALVSCKIWDGSSCVEAGVNRFESMERHEFGYVYIEIDGVYRVFYIDMYIAPKQSLSNSDNDVTNIIKTIESISDLSSNIKSLLKGFPLIGSTVAILTISTIMFFKKIIS